MNEFLAYVMTNADALLLAAAAVHAAAVAVTNLTPTPKDDAFVAKAYRVVEIAAGLISRKAKQ